MPRETKSNGQKDPLDRFYTPANIVDTCLDLFNFSDYDCIIEPSAGTGEFSLKIPNCFAYDISPENDSIIQADWLKLDKEQFKKYKNILVIGNPPFGEQNTLAIKFFNESAKFCNKIGFILPLSFKKISVQNQLNLSFSLEKEIVFGPISFKLKNKEEITVPCVFQVWGKTVNLREKQHQKTTSIYFDFVPKDLADFRIQRVGGNAGKASFDLNRAISSNYFIKNKTNISNEKIIEFINQLFFPSIAYTVGPKSLSKGELIEVFEQEWNNFFKSVE